MASPARARCADLRGVSPRTGLPPCQGGTQGGGSGAARPLTTSPYPLLDKEGGCVTGLAPCALTWGRLSWAGRQRERIRHAFERIHAGRDLVEPHVHLHTEMAQAMWSGSPQRKGGARAPRAETQPLVRSASGGSREQENETAIGAPLRRGAANGGRGRLPNIILTHGRGEVKREIGEGRRKRRNVETSRRKAETTKGGSRRCCRSRGMMPPFPCRAPRDAAFRRRCHLTLSAL